jgi:protein-disulfide isomerase
MHRRDALRTTGALALAGLAGCTSVGLGGSGGGGGDGDENSGSGGGNAGPIPDHPATAGVESQPHHGDLGGTMVVAFEDPSCPRCAAFEQQTVPKVVSNVVEPGLGSFVVRGYPVVYPWGEPASHALEATYDRSESAFWSLADHYFAAQGEFSTENVADRTRQFLADETDVDAEAVVADATDSAFEDAVQTDLDAGEAAGAGRTTPHVFLFDDGEYLTKAQGSVSYDLVANALGV